MANAATNGATTGDNQGRGAELPIGVVGGKKLSARAGAGHGVRRKYLQGDDNVE
jgi:hypothetical protein